ncbi:MAG: hypothetical protein EHM59_08130 [Betaproteobacteria bacterium]|nr:MAG: hypothetical protein EHM59_08130 [Betaproteobacteria bacterium]
MRTDRVWLYALVALLAACTTLPPDEPQPAPEPSPPPVVVAPPPPEPEPIVEPSPPPVPVVAEPPASVRALEYFARQRQRSAKELKIEYDTVRKSFAGSRSAHDRVRLALLLSLPHNGLGDEAQALELLDPLTRDAASEYQSLAQLMTVLLTEQRRRGSQAMALQQKLDRIKALENEMQQRAATPEPRPR